MIAGGERANARVAPGPHGKNTGAPGRGDRKSVRRIFCRPQGALCFFCVFCQGFRVLSARSTPAYSSAASCRAGKYGTLSLA